MGKANCKKDEKSDDQKPLQHPGSLRPNSRVYRRLANAPGFAEENGTIQKTSAHAQKQALQEQLVLRQQHPEYRNG
jgi:hypothetical protein